MKKNALKILIPIICIVLVMTLLVVWFISCQGIFAEEEISVRSNEIFQYIIVDEYDRATEDNTQVISIIGFTSLGLDQETIDIPSEIDGIPVRYIGYEGHRGSNIHRVHCGENLKKIYIHNNITKIVNFYGSEVDMMICLIENHIIFGVNASFKRRYIYKSLFEMYNYSSDFFSPANVVFMNNYSNEVNDGYYRLDNIEDGEKIPVPPIPERSGYGFIGWYTEPECISVWDFNVSPAIGKDTEFRLYAAWQAK